MRVLSRPKLTFLVTTLALVALIALPLTASAASLHSQGQSGLTPYSRLLKMLSSAGSPISGLNQQLYDDSAYPSSTISYDQAIGAYNAFQTVSSRAAGGNGQSWQLIGPTTMKVPAVVTYTGRATTNSGRVTALAISHSCNQAKCRIWVGAAGGGIWTTNNGLASTPNWRSSSVGIASNAIGSIVLDPNDSTGATLYAGTGEPNGSSDSEAGVGLYKSTNFGRTWQLVPGSVAAAKDRSIGAVAIDPTNANHIYIGTDVARHGSASVNGGRFTPPGAPQIGLY